MQCCQDARPLDCRREVLCWRRRQRHGTRAYMRHCWSWRVRRCCITLHGDGGQACFRAQRRAWRAPSLQQRASQSESLGGEGPRDSALGGIPGGGCALPATGGFVVCVRGTAALTIGRGVLPPCKPPSGADCCTGFFDRLQEPLAHNDMRHGHVVCLRAPRLLAQTPAHVASAVRGICSAPSAW